MQKKTYLSATQISKGLYGLLFWHTQTKHYATANPRRNRNSNLVNNWGQGGVEGGLVMLPVSTQDMFISAPGMKGGRRGKVRS